MPIMNKLKASYLAGLIDGEGYIGIMKHKRYDDLTKNHYREVIKIANTDKKLIEWLKNSFGGDMEERKWKNGENYKTAYCWSKKYTNTEEILRKIMPYLRVKKKQAEIVLEVIKTKKKWWQRLNRNRSNTPAYRKEDWQKLEKLYWQIRKLNKKGILAVEETERSNSLKRDTTVQSCENKIVS